MDNLTHTLTGALLGAALAPESGARSVPTRTRVVLAALATNAPDLDLLASPFFDAQTMLVLHRGITHSFLLAPLWALPLAAIAWLLTRRQHRFRDLWLIAGFAVALHAGLDLLTAYGTQVFAPLSERSFALPVLFIIDLWVWALLAVGALLAWRRRSPAVAGATLLALGGYIAACTLLMLTASATAEAKARELGPRLHGFALPQPFSPLRWKLVAMGRNSIHTAYLDLLPGAAPPEWRKRHRYGEDPALRNFGRHAWERPELAPFRRFALMPQLYATEQPNPNQLCGWFTDLRFEAKQRASPFRIGICHGRVLGAIDVDPERGWTLATGPAPQPPE